VSNAAESKIDEVMVG
ncbi:hypothetical protein A2U01_0111225, partial [Trifolium medium]|nr:hypothetical protein [Trifolium medium]